MIYHSVTTAKNGEPIPVFLDGKPMHSKYRPSAERLSLPPAQGGQDEGFFIIGGIGAAYHIQNLCSALRNYHLIAFEADRESLAFCRQFPLVQGLKRNEHITLCTADELAVLLPRYYMPSLYGNFVSIMQRAWQEENAELCRKSSDICGTILKQISADYSVQSHFGKIWQHNILANLAAYSPSELPPIDTARTAAIIAAGPSLDSSIGLLKERRQEYAVIATDTSYGTLLANKIEPDIVLSVDGQHISSTHFFCCPPRPRSCKPPLFVFDICTSPETTKLVRSRGYPSYYVQSGHPLSQLAGKYVQLPFVETGAGTVTIACCDFARLLGYKKLQLFGADFAYSAGKPYTKGTYLESSFLSTAHRTEPAEQRFTALMYRTPLSQKAEGIYTTDILQQYAATLQNWMEKYGYVFHDGCYCNEDAKPMLSPSPKGRKFDFPQFIAEWKSQLAQAAEGGQWQSNAYTATLLPYIAWLRSQKNLGKLPVLELFKLAYSHISRYN